MKRLIPFLFAVCCAAGLIAGSVNVLTDRSDDLVFTEVVRYGDPEALAGRTIESGIQSGDHMEWRTVYTFAGENRYDTEFLFTQKVAENSDAGTRAYMSVYNTSGMGGSTNGDMNLQNTGYGDMVRAVAAITGPGEEQEMKLKLSDYTDYHALNLDIHYITEDVYCSEAVDAWDHFTARHNEVVTDFDRWVATEASVCYGKFSQLFRFPVADDEIATVSATRDNAGNLVSMGFNIENSTEISIICAVNDRGAYCIPTFRRDDQPLQGEYRDGMGIYLIPWMELEGVYQYVNRGGTREQVQVITLDVDKAENILPMEEDAIVFGLEVADGSSLARMISLEDDTYYLTEIDLANREIKSRLAVLKKAPGAEYYWPSWQIRDNLMVIEACKNLALITLDGEPVLEFAVPLGPVEQGYWDVVDDYADLYYDGDRLTLAACRGFYDTRSLAVQVFDKTGPLYWGEYECSVFACNDPGASPWITNRDAPLIIQ